MGKIRLLVSDFVLTFMWMWSGVLVNMLVHGVLKFGHDTTGELVRYAFSLANMFLFALFQTITGGGLFNPLTALASAVSGGALELIYTVGFRIPAEVIGAILGVKHILHTFPEIGRGPRLKVAIHHGALTEGMLTFVIVIITLGLSRKITKGFFMKTWISSLCKLTLHILGSDLTGGCMNPAAVIGWAYARDEHITKEHLVVYWLAPVKATILAVCIFRVVVKPLVKEAEKSKSKSE